VANGPGGPPGDGHGPGHGLAAMKARGGPGQGLAGMRERVALLGGSLTAGPDPGGGFVVSAVLPTGQAA
jgi:signal transduction histidine kinase